MHYGKNKHEYTGAEIFTRTINTIGDIMSGI